MQFAIKILCLLVFTHAFCAVATGSPLVETPWYSIDLPQGWILPQDPAITEEQGVEVLFLNKTRNCAVSITVNPSTLTAKEIAYSLVASLRKNGLIVSQPSREGHLWSAPFRRGGAGGKAWFGANGKEGSVVLVMGASLEPAAELLANLKAADPNLFPRI